MYGSDFKKSILFLFILENIILCVTENVKVFQQQQFFCLSSQFCLKVIFVQSKYNSINIEGNWNKK